MQQKAEAWPAKQKASVIGVNSFGFGGTNAHVVLDAVPEPVTAVSAPGAASGRSAYLLPISARGPEALKALAEAYRDLADAPDSATATPVADLAYCGRCAALPTGEPPGADGGFKRQGFRAPQGLPGR